MKYRYYVGSNFSFPDDMLRYDRAKIIRVIQERKRDPRQPGIWLIEGETPPTVARWKSFLYSVWLNLADCPFERIEGVWR